MAFPRHGNGWQRLCLCTSYLRPQPNGWPPLSTDLTICTHWQTENQSVLSLVPSQALRTQKWDWRRNTSGFIGDQLNLSQADISLVRTVKLPVCVRLAWITGLWDLRLCSILWFSFLWQATFLDNTTQNSTKDSDKQNTMAILGDPNQESQYPEN